jgi:predicted glycosyltransferase
MEEIGAITVLHEKDLQPRRLAAIIRNSMIAAKPVAHSIDLDGAARTAGWLQAAVAD